MSFQDYQAIVDAEWNILYDKLEKIHQSGAKVILSKLPIGDVATQYFADRDMFCAGRVPEEDLKRTMMVNRFFSPHLLVCMALGEGLMCECSPISLAVLLLFLVLQTA